MASCSSDQEYKYEYTDVEKCQREDPNRDYFKFKVSGSFSRETLHQWIEEDIKNKMDDVKYTPENVHHIKPIDEQVKEDIIVICDVVHAFALMEPALTRLGASSIYHAIKNLPEYDANKLLWLNMGNIKQEMAAFSEIVYKKWIWLPNTKSTGYETAWWAIAFLEDGFKKPPLYIELEKKAIETNRKRIAADISRDIQPILQQHFTDDMDFMTHWNEVFEEIKKQSYPLFYEHYYHPAKKRRYYRYHG